MATVALDANNFASTIKSNEIVLVDLWASWCGPCMKFGPIYEKVSEKYPEIVFGKVDTEENRDIAAQLDIVSIPTILGFRGGEMVFRQSGALNTSQLESVIEQLKSAGNA